MKINIKSKKRSNKFNRNTAIQLNQLISLIEIQQFN